MTAWNNWLPNADAVEIAWTVVNAIGTTFATIGTVMTAVNLRAARRAHRRAEHAEYSNALYLDITHQSVRNETLSVTVLTMLVIVLAFFAAIGMLAITTPPPIRPEVRATDLASTLVLVGCSVLLTTVAFLLTLGSVLNRRDRHDLTNKIAGRLVLEQLARRREHRLQDGGSS